jgi:phosphate transport system substrate-binding protein
MAHFGSTTRKKATRMPHFSLSSDGGSMSLGRICLVFFQVAIAGLSSGASADPLILQGSTTFARHLLSQEQKGKIEAESGHDLTVIPNKSAPGIIGLLEGRAHLAMISAPIAVEIAMLKAAMPGIGLDRLQAHEISRVRISIVVNKTNEVRNASVDQVTKILTGAITNWSTLGGANKRIRVVLVGGGGGVTAVVENALLDGNHASAADVLYVKSPIQLVQVVEQEPGYVGFAQYELAKQRESPELKMERPIEQVLSFVTYGPPTPAMRAVIDATRRASEQRF